MYYQISSEKFLLDGIFGKHVMDVTYDNGQHYNTQRQDLSTHYKWDAEITDYSSSPKVSYLSSGRFPAKYEQTYLPVRHHKRSLTVEPGSPVLRERNVGSRHDRFEHDGNMTHASIWWSKVNTSLKSALAWPLRDDTGHPLSWDTCEASARQALPHLLNDSKLLNLEQVGLATFLAELRDIGRLGDLAKFHRNTSDVSDKYLGVNFGVLPLVSDIKKMYELTENLSPALDTWNSMSNKGKVRAYHHTVDRQTRSGTHSYIGGSEGTIIDHSYSYEYEWEQELVTKAHAYVAPHSSSPDHDLRLKASLWGLDKPLTAVWNAIPYSFAVDWVSNIGDIISDFEYSEPTLGFDVIGYGSSQKLITSITCRAFLHLWGEKIPIGTSTIEDSTYYRTPLPISDVYTHMNDFPIGPLEFSTALSGYQISLTAALAHQRWYKL